MVDTVVFVIDVYVWRDYHIVASRAAAQHLRSKEKISQSIIHPESRGQHAALGAPALHLRNPTR